MLTIYHWEPNANSGKPNLHARILAWARFINEVLMPAVSTLGCRAFLVPKLKGQDALAGDLSGLRP